MANSPICPICALGDEVCSEVARRFSVGLPASEVASWLGGQGRGVTQRQLVDHRRHVVDLKSPSVALTTLKDPSLPLRPLISAPDLSDYDREERMLLGFLAATDRLLADFAETGSIKIARTAAEVGKVAAAMLNSKMDRVVQTDPVINIVLSRHRLEDSLKPINSIEGNQDD